MRGSPFLWLALGALAGCDCSIGALKHSPQQHNEDEDARRVPDPSAPTAGEGGEGGRVQVEMPDAAPPQASRDAGEDTEVPDASLPDAADDALPYLVFSDRARVLAARVDHLDALEDITPKGAKPWTPFTRPVLARDGELVFTLAGLNEDALSLVAIDRAHPSGPLLHILHREPIDWADLPDVLPDPYVSPDGRYVALHRPSAAPLLFRLDAGGATPLAHVVLSASGNVPVFSFSSDGRYFAARGTSPQVVDLERGEVVTFPSGAPGSPAGVAFTRAATHLAHTYFADGRYGIEIITLPDELEHGGGTAVDAPEGASVRLSHAGERVLFATVDRPDTGATAIVAFDLTGAEVARFEGALFRRSCGTAVVLQLADGSIALVRDTVDGVQSAVLPLPGPVGEIMLSTDCRGAAYELGSDVRFLDLPAPGDDVSTLAVHAAEHAALVTVHGTATGTVVQLRDRTSQRLELADAQGVLAGFPAGSTLLAITPDGESALWERPYPDQDEHYWPRQHDVVRTALRGEARGSHDRLHGPVQRVNDFAITQDSEFAVASLSQSLTEDGVPVGAGGLVDIDLRAAGLVTPRVLLPSGTLTRTTTLSLQRIPNRHAVLIRARDRDTAGSELFVRALDGGHSTVLQAHNGPPNARDRGEPLLHPDGNAIAVHRTLHGYDAVASISLRDDEEEQAQIFEADVSWRHRIAGFGGDERTLVIKERAQSAGLEAIVRRDLATGTARTLLGRALTADVALITASGRAFIENCPGNCVVLLDDPDSTAPRALTSGERSSRMRASSVDGEQIVIGVWPFADRSTEIQVLGAQRDWEPISLGSAAAAPFYTAFYAGPGRNGVLVAIGSMLHRVERGSARVESHELAGPVHWMQVASRAPFAVVLTRTEVANRHALHLFAIDSGALNELAAPAGMVRSAALSPDGRFVLYARDEDGLHLLADLERRIEPRELPEGAHYPSFDASGRFLLYRVMDAESTEYHVMALADPHAPVLGVELEGRSYHALWVD